MRHFEGTNPEQAVDRIEVQAGRQGRGVGDLEPELGLDDLSRLVVHAVVLIRICGKVQLLAGGTLALKKQNMHN